jgi:BASS family bile acid:Na+ symporter
LNLRSISQFLQRHLLWFLSAAYVVAAVFPATGLQIRNISFGELIIYQQKINISLLMVMLATLMFNAGFGLNISHIKKYAEKKYVLLAGLIANIAIPIIYIFGVTVLMQFWYEPVEAQYILVGLALVAAMPIAGGSTAWVQNANGNLALSLGLVLFSTVLSPIITPVTFNIFGEMASEEFEKVLQGLAVYGSGAFLGFWVVLPSLLGIAVRMIVAEHWIAGGMPYLKLINSIVLLLLNYSNAAVSLPQAIASQDYDFLAVTLIISAGLCLSLFAAGYGMSRLFKLDLTERVSLMFGLGMNNNGTGLILASLALSAYPNVMVPIIFYNLIQHIAAGTVNEVMNRGGRG